ncbi:hypothetical protein [Streptomyces arenae]|uniref:hypothetical protein n=1 Tax=Streptomyces arenae TaxID=29301 RepID=UPI00265ABF60|nr:hypothetical protein [Streptomyces arenae]MCG7208210.1 hypothetical protein [Streptomyces arenae]
MPQIASRGIAVMVSDVKVKGSAVYAIPGGIESGKVLAIAINCQGSGVLTVQVKPAGVSFPLTCEKGEIIPTLNEIQMSKDHPEASLNFTSKSNVTWSFAAGWDPNPPRRQ